MNDSNNENNTDNDILDALILRLSAEFDEIATDRRVMGEQEYGKNAYLELDMWQHMIEEVVDLANYARFQYIKLRMFQIKEQGNLGFHSNEPQVGPRAFTPSEKRD